MGTLFGNLRKTANETMKEIGLADGYIKSLNCIWNAFEKWLEEKGLEYSPDIGTQFLREKYGLENLNYAKLSPANRRRLRALKILSNCFNHKPYFDTRDRRYEQHFAPSHEKLLIAFLDDQLGFFSESTRCSYIYSFNQFSRFLAQAGIDDLGAIGKPDIIAYFEKLGTKGLKPSYRLWPCLQNTKTRRVSFRSRHLRR